MPYALCETFVKSFSHRMAPLFSRSPALALSIALFNTPIVNLSRIIHKRCKFPIFTFRSPSPSATSLQRIAKSLEVTGKSLKKN